MTEDVRQFVVDALDKMQFDVSEVGGTTSLGPDGLDLESLTIAELAIQIEDRFGVKIDEDEAERVALMTIDELAAEVAKRAGSVRTEGQPA
jgi:acyl carrier protein